MQVTYISDKTESG